MTIDEHIYIEGDLYKKLEVLCSAFLFSLLFKSVAMDVNINTFLFCDT